MKQKLESSKADYFEVVPYFLRVFIPFSVLLLLAVVIYTSVETWYEKRLIQAEQQQQVELAHESLQQDILGVIHEMKYLADSLKPYIESDGQHGEAEAKGLVSSFAANFQRYDQIRWLDLEGMERLRVDYRQGSVRVVAEDKLQDKSSRYYFSEAIQLEPGAIYTSPLDLNVEHGEIELPHRPMLRYAMPTKDGSGKKNGLLVLNYQASRMLEKFSSSKRVEVGELYLLNTNGYWLSASDSSPLWGFMFKSERSFANSFPKIWQEVSKGNQGSREMAQGMVSFLPVRHTIFDINSNLVALDDELDEYSDLEQQSVKWLILALYPREAIRNIYIKHFRSYSTLLIIALLVLAVVSWRRGRLILERNSLLDTLALHAKVMETSTNGVLITDSEPKVIAINSAFTELTGYSEEEIVGSNPSILSSGRHDKAFYDEMWQSLDIRGHWEGEIWNRHKSGELFPEWMSISAVYDHEGNLSNYIGIFSVLAEQQGTEERLRELANSDMLTGLINRNLFYDRASQAIAQCRRSQTRAAILFLDLDGFKPINDTLGHAAGDKVLKTVAERLTGCVRETDTVARFGGDEFLILLTGIESREVAMELAEKIIAHIAEPIELEEESCHVGASVGIGIYPDDALTVEEMIRCADQAMYQAKDSGKQCARFYQGS